MEIDAGPAPMAPEVERKLLGLLGLGARARNVVIGVERVRDGVRKGKVRLAILAPDASRHSKDKVVPMLLARRVVIVEGPGAASLGAAVGKDTTAVVGVTDPSLAAGIRRLLSGVNPAPRAAGTR